MCCAMNGINDDKQTAQCEGKALFRTFLLYQNDVAAIQT